MTATFQRATAWRKIVAQYLAYAANKEPARELTPLNDPLGHFHHSDAPFTDADRELADKLSSSMGDLFINCWKDPPVEQWRRVARALRIHGLQIINAPER